MMLERYQQMREGRLQDVKWKYILKALREQNVISALEETQLLSIESKAEQDKEVVKLLTVKEGGRQLIEALNSKGYPWIGKDIESFIHLYAEAQDRLRVGFVPYRASHEMDRTALKARLLDDLQWASKAPDGRRWVVLHGMVGSGKTTLAAQTLRDPSVTLDLFSGHICWVNLGDIDQNKLLLKIQALCDQLDHNFQPTSKERCQLFLRRHFSQHKGHLLILDDVQSSRVISDMDFGIPVLVTTKNMEIMPTSLITATKYFQLEEGFSLEQSKTLMANFMNVSTSELPPSCEHIHNKYKGSPLVIALVSGHMLRFKRPTEDHWDDVWKKLQDRQLNRIRHASGNAHLKEFVKFTVDSLNGDKLREYFKDFALFWEDLYIPQRVFEILWDLSNFDTEEIMSQLESLSLIRRREESVHLSGSFSGSINGFSYGIHDLLLDYLKEEDKSTKVDHHTKLVDRYIEKYIKINNGHQNFGLLPADRYIHMFLGYHLSHSQRTNLFPLIYFDLRFLQVKVEESGVYDLLYDFKTYDKFFPKKQLEDFVRFTSQNGSQLSCRSYNHSASFDLMQLALMEPSTSAVHQAAIKILPHVLGSKKNKRKYYRWCNQRNVRSSLLLSVRPHSQKAANYVAFSPKDKLVASAGQDNMLRLWDCCLGKEVLQFQEHDSAVNACCFSPCGSLLMSASEGGELKIWTVHDNQHFFPNDFKLTEDLLDEEPPETPKPRLHSFSFSTPSNSPSANTANPSNSCVTPIMSWEETNKISVTACTFSRTMDKDHLLAASGYEDGKIKVWSFSKESCIQTLEGHTARITSLSFCDERLLASSSRDEKVIVWDLRTGMIRKLEHDDLVVCCQLNRSGDRVLAASGKFVWQWDLTSEETPKQYNGLKSSFLLSHCAYSPKEDFIAGGTSDRSVVLWNVETREVVATYKGLADCINCVSFSPDGSKLVSASSDGNVVLWGLPVHQLNNNNQNSSSSRVSLTTHLDAVFLQNKNTASPMVVVSDDSNHIQLISGLEGTLSLRSPKEKEDISACALSPSGDCIVYATKSGSLKMCQKQNDTGAFDMVISLPVNGQTEISICTFSSNGRWFMSCAADGSILRWPAESNGETIPEQLVGHTDDFCRCRMYVSIDGEPEMLTCSSDGTMRTWSLETCQELTSVSHNGETVTCGDVHPERNIQVSSSVDMTVKIWRHKDGTNLGNFDFDSCVRSCRFDSTGKLVAGGDDDGMIKVYDVETKYLLHTLQEHTSFVYDLHFSPDSQRLVSSGDGLRWWSLSPPNKSKTHSALQQSMCFHGGEIRTLFVSTDFSVFVMVDNNGYLFILKEMFEGAQDI